MKFTSEQKMGKRERSALNKSRRTTWEFSPITRVKPSKKLYKREKVRYVCE